MHRRRLRQIARTPAPLDYRVVESAAGVIDDRRVAALAKRDLLAQLDEIAGIDGAKRDQVADRHDQIDGRAVKWSARKIAMRWPDHSIEAVAADLKQADGQGGADTDYEIVHAVFRADDPAYGIKRTRGDRDISGADWRSVYVAVEADKVLSEGGHREQRYFASRWSKASSEIYGRSPAMEALPDIKTLNTLRKYGLEGLVLSVYPAWLFPDESIIGRLKIKPGAPNLYNPKVSGEIRALTSEGNFRIEAQVETELRQAIAAAFLDDVLGTRDSGQVTATEILDRRERRQQVTNPAVSRIETELLEPLLSTCWLMMQRAGAFGDQPAALQGRDFSVEVVFLSALARAQKLIGARSLQDTFAILGPLIQSNPGMLDHYDFDAMARDVPDDIGVPRKWLNDLQTVAATRDARAQAAQAAQQVQQGLSLAAAGASIDESAARAQS